MAKQAAKLRLSPDRCDRCGSCIAACEANAIKVGPSYIYVDWRACNGCYACAKACDRGAIERRDEAKSAPAKRSRTDSGKVAASGKHSKASTSKKKDLGDEPPQWSLLEGVAIMAVVFAAFIGKDIALNSSWTAAMTPSDAVTARVFVLMLFYAVQIAALMGLARFRGVRFWAAYGLSRTDVGWIERVKSVGLVLGLLVGTRVLVLIYQLVVRALGWQSSGEWSTSISDVFGPEQTGLVLAVIMVVVAAPIVEEMVFRGILRGSIEVRWGMWPAIVVSSAFFAAYHFNAWLAVPVFILGTATGWLASTRSGLWPAIWLHALFNAVPIVLAFVTVA